MADQQVGNQHGLPVVEEGDADSRSNLSGTDDPQAGFVDADLASISAMRARLTAIDGSYYDADKLNQMTYNDMVYAIRVNDHPSTIK